VQSYKFNNLEITTNRQGADRFQKMSFPIRNELDRYYSKGAVYLSPLIANRNRQALMRRFAEIKSLSRLPVYLYLIQQL
jgi:hypothetical protein